MTETEVLDLFRKAGGLLEGHFLYASGRHGRQFLQAARVLQYPNHTETLCRQIAMAYADEGVELVCGPATGGILLAYETARHLHCRSAFTEKDGGGGMSLKRGFHLRPGARVLVVEDVVTTGGSVAKTIAHLEDRGAKVIGVGALVERGGGEAEFGCPFRPLARIHMVSWAPSECPLCRDRVELTDPDELVV